MCFIICSEISYNCLVFVVDDLANTDRGVTTTMTYTTMYTTMRGDDVTLKGYTFNEKKYTITDSTSEIPFFVVESFEISSSNKFRTPSEFDTIKFGFKTNIKGSYTSDGISYFRIWAAVSPSGYDLYDEWDSLRICSGSQLASFAESSGVVIWGPGMCYCNTAYVVVFLHESNLCHDPVQIGFIVFNIFFLFSLFVCCDRVCQLCRR